MKKLFTFFSALLLTVSMWGADSNKYEMLSVSDFNAVTNESINGYTVTFKTKGYRNSTTYDYNVTLYLKNADDIEGVFSVGTAQDELLTTSTIIWTSDGTTRYPVTSSSYPTNLTISKVSGFPEKYQISGLWRAAKSTSSTSPYVYNFDTYEPTCYLPPYGLEPEQTTIDFSNASLELTSESEETPLQFSLTSGYYYSALIQFNVSEYAALPAGPYNVASSGEGTIMASAGFDANDMPAASYYEDYSDWTPLDYCITGGSLTIAYSEDQKTMTMSGTLTSAHGSTINVSASGSNPWFIPEPETVELTVSKVDVSKGNGYFDLYLTANKNNFMIDLDGDALAGADINDVNAQYTYADLGGYNNYSGMDATKTEVNALSIEATGNTDEYKLNATIVCKNNNTYVMKDVIFTYETPNAWTEEPKGVADFKFTSTSGSEEFLSNKGYMLFTFSNAGNEARIAIAASSEGALAATTYNVVNDNPVAGDVVGSAGKVGYNTYNPSLIYISNPSGWFFVRGGSVKVGYSQDNKTLTMTGDVTTYRGTTITLNLAMENPFLPKEKTLDITSIDATITVTGMDFDIATASKFDPSEVMLSLIGTAKNPLAIVGSYNYSNFESSYSYADTKDGYYEFKTGSTIEITNGEGGCVMNGTLLCQNGWTYFIEDAPITYSMAVSDQASPVASLNRAMNATVDMTIQRTFFCDGDWNTICLPFDWTIGGDNDPLAGATVAQYVSANYDGEAYVLDFEATNSLEAGKPYLIRWEAGDNIENPVFKNVVVKAYEGTELKDGNATFAGVLKPTEMSGENMRFVTVGNELSYASENGNLKGFRAYFKIDDAQNIPARFVIRGVATGLENTQSTLKNGKFIINGQLIIVKDSKIFNAQGQQL